jgi:hypothetical protein
MGQHSMDSADGQGLTCKAVGTGSAPAFNSLGLTPISSAVAVATRARTLRPCSMSVHQAKH